MTAPTPGGTTESHHQHVLRYAKPLSVAAAIVEVVAAVAGLAAKIPLWVASAACVGIPLSAYALSLKTQLRNTQRSLQEATGRDRIYVFYEVKITCFPSPIEGYIGGVIEGRRQLVAMAPIGVITYSWVRRSDSDISFSVLPVLASGKVLRRGGGDACFVGLIKQQTTLTVRFEFDPPLRPGEECELEYRVEVPVYKSGTLATLRKRPLPNVPAPGEAELSSITISNPIRLLRFEMAIPKSLGTSRHGLQVLRDQAAFPEEEEEIRRGGYSEVALTHTGDGPYWNLRLERRDPPIRTRYRWHWAPPDAPTPSP